MTIPRRPAINYNSSSQIRHVVRIRYINFYWTWWKQIFKLIWEVLLRINTNLIETIQMAILWFVPRLSVFHRKENYSLKMLLGWKKKTLSIFCKISLLPNFITEEYPRRGCLYSITVCHLGHQDTGTYNS